MRSVFLYMIFGFAMMGCSNASDLLLYQKDKVLPYILVEDKRANAAAKIFKELFKKTTGIELEILNQARDFSGQPGINLVLTDDKKDHFLIEGADEKLLIKGSYPEDLEQGIYYFFEHIVHADSTKHNLSIGKKMEEIILPKNLLLKGEDVQDFHYREPYFPINSSKEFQQKYNTNSLENAWGLWGHNIGKFINLTEDMYALVDGKRNPEQLDFSSSSLETALTFQINKSLTEDPNRRRFMIMPNDNKLVCNCDACLKAGNTKTNSSPALLKLINKLALVFPEAIFFTSDYLSSSTPIAQKLPTNTGVMISTMDFPKGIVLKGSKHEVGIKDRFKKWSEITNHIYIWDYAINFDNYMDAHPTLLIQQENLRFYKDLGVTGVFMQGNEDSYSAFENLKASIYAQLLENLDLDIPKAINKYLQHFSDDHGKFVADYYLQINQRALQNKNPLDIYGGVRPALKKYLKQDELQKFYKDLSLAGKDIAPSFRDELFKLKISVLFQLLELARTNGLADNGYGIYDFNLQQGRINEDLRSQFSVLKKLIELTDLETYNESKAKFADYFNNWEKLIFNKPYSNLLYGQVLTIKSKLDEGYDDPNILTDGAIGFEDYYNNWMICTQDNLSIEFPINHKISGKRTLEITFLIDRRHRLDLPQGIQVQYDGKSPIIKQEFSAISEKLKRVTYQFPLSITPEDKILSITIQKQSKSGFACDEIILN